MNTAAPQAIFDQGLALHQAGRLDEARQRYEAALAIDPNHFDALHMLGVSCIQTGQRERAVELIRRAVRVNPAVAAAHGNLANVLNGLRRFDEALACCDRAIALNPQFAEAHGNRGQALNELGRYQEALASYERVVALKPTAQAFFNQATLLREVGRQDAALESFDRALALKSDHAEAHRGRGVILSELGRAEEALESLDRALGLRPDYAEAHFNRAIALRELQRPEEALASHDRAIALKPTYSEAYNHRGNALIDLKRFEDGLLSYERAIELKSDYADAHNNLGNALYEVRSLEPALASFRRAVALEPDHAEYHSNMGVVLNELRRLDEAMASYDQALVLQPENPETHHNQAMCRLTLGDFAEGWAQYEWRWRAGQFSAGRELDAPLWLGGECLAGRTILLRAEQGLGDTLQFCRYVADVAAMDAKVVLEVQPGLERLLARLGGVNQVVALGADDLPPYDFHTPLMSLPLALGANPVARHGDYLSAIPEEAAAWAARLAPSGKLRVGLCWAGGVRPDRRVANRIDQRRSLSLDAFSALARVEGIQVYSLQKGPPAAQLAEAKARGWSGPQVIDLTAELKDFADTAAFVANLDLVITCDTAVAHLAGGLGKPVWILNRYDACWRWLNGRDDSPWYPSARLFRQPAPGDWDGVIERVTRALSLLA